MERTTRAQYGQDLCTLPSLTVSACNVQGIILHEYHYWFFAVALKPEQEAAAELTAFPFFPVRHCLYCMTYRGALPCHIFDVAHWCAAVQNYAQLQKWPFLTVSKATPEDA